MGNDPYKETVIDLNHLIGIVKGLVGIEQDRGKKAYLQLCLAKLEDAREALKKAVLSVR